MRSADTGPAGRPVFHRNAFAALVRAAHPDRRFPIAVSRLRVGPLDREPDVVTAWVYGAYATVLGRLPDADGLRTHEAWLRSGGDPAQLVARMVSSDEARDTAPESEADLDDVFVTGAYLVALGRRPDPGGAETQRSRLREGGRHADVLASMLQSAEAQAQLRFPPAVLPVVDQLARAIQLVAVGDVDPAVHQVLVEAVEDRRPLGWLVRTAVRLRRGRRALLREIPRAWWLGQMAQQQVHHESLARTLEATTEWNWRVQRRLMDRIDELSAEVAALRAKSRPGTGT